MTKEAFLGIQSEVLSGGKQLKSILAAHGVPYSTYNYWRNKITSNDGNLPIAPIYKGQNTQFVFISTLFPICIFFP